MISARFRGPIVRSGYGLHRRGQLQSRCQAARPSHSDDSNDPSQSPDMRNSPEDPTPSSSPRGLGDSIALALGSLKPEQVIVMGGVSKIIAMSYSGMALMCPAPAALASLIGHGNAVALTMIPGGMVLCAVGAQILKRKWHETRIGLATIVTVCLLLIYFFFVDGNARRMAMAQAAYRAASMVHS